MKSTPDKNTQLSLIPQPKNNQYSTQLLIIPQHKAGTRNQNPHQCRNHEINTRQKTPNQHHTSTWNNLPPPTYPSAILKLLNHDSPHWETHVMQIPLTQNHYRTEEETYHTGLPLINSRRRSSKATNGGPGTQNDLGPHFSNCPS